MKFVCILFMIWPWPARVSWCSTHWVMTEDGRIQAQADSMFFMKRPYDFVALAQQERRAASIEELRKELVTHKVEIDRNDDNNQDVEKKVYAEDPHCLKAGQPLTEFNLYPSVAIDLDKDTGVKLESVLDMSSEITSDFQQPDCTKYMPLDFSMFTFEHLVGMKDRASLSMTGEVDLAELVGGPEGERVFGHRVDAALQRRPTHWAAYHLAALYWRVQGEAPRAVECARRAVHLASRSMRFVGMVDLGAVLHRCRRSDGGAVLLHAAIDHNDQSWQAHLALGSAYAVLGDYNRSITCFNNTIKLHPGADADARRLNAVICHQRLEQALENQHSSLQNTLSELRIYQKQHSQWLEKQDKLVLEQADLEERVRSRLNHEEHQALQRSDVDVNSCVRVQRDGHGMLDCGVVAADSGHQVTANQPPDHTLARVADPTQEGDADEIVAGPTLSPRYVQLHEHATDAYLSDHWPTAAECEHEDTKLPDVNSFPTVYLSPQNKGFDVSWYLSEAIGVPATDEHALPWFPPVCEPLPAGRTTAYDQLESIRQRARYQSRRLADPLAEEALSQLVAAPSQRAVVPAEIGQRITSAIKQGVVPGWLGSTLAALYWRSQGHVLNVLECLRAALHDVPALHRDVPLVSLAALLHRLDDVDGALKVAKHAYQVNDIEPDTNMLLGGLLAVRGNYTGALWHYRRALQADSAYTAARHMLLSVACYSRFQGQKREQQCQTPAQTPVDDDPILDKLAKMPRDSVVCTSECLDGSGQELCESKISCYHAHNDNGRWVLTPTPSGQPECHGATAADVIGGSSSMEQLGGLLQEPGSCLQDLHPPPLDPMQDEQDHMELMASLVVDPLPLMDALLELQTPPPPADWHQLLELSVTEAVPGARADGVDDDELPELLQLPADRPLPPPPSVAECHALRHISVNQLTSTWLSISSKHVNVDLSESDSVVREPVCPELFPASLLTLDSLSGVRHRRQLVASAESGLREALQTLSGQLHRSVDETAARIAASLQQNGTSWVFNTAAALYWRVRGDGPRAVSCLRVALHHSPRPYRDIPLISLANVLYRAGLYNDALIACNAALDVSPYFVVIHFTMANIYAAKGDTERAMQFYQSTLELQGSFQPARERLRAIQCSLTTSP